MEHARICDGSWAPWDAAPEGAGGFAVGFESRLEDGSASICFVQLFLAGSFVVSERVIWRCNLERPRLARDVLVWMRDRREQWQLWGRLTALTGHERLLARAIKEVTESRSRSAEKLLRRRQKERGAREREKEISSYLVDDDQHYCVDMRRGGHKEGFFVMRFREKWERERFRDWWVQQRHRFGDFAAYVDENGAAALERMLLREMQDTEKRIKKAGLGAGGRRPLRFWRGDEL
ncbi:hypothetical protein [Sphingomonas sp. BK069]|uniref:hypothetical protein n=1 Tax=Sphingomonas sp. BK069 TaxID=2586979 RepID=UPI00160BB131|nr:hypothetical protein [Sphingomonas sp. BK069]MBB3348397.1 hypothetical protein [Sphingomonas sp. BK069]